jgi:hypothetical protein
MMRRLKRINDIKHELGTKSTFFTILSKVRAGKRWLPGSIQVPFDSIRAVDAAGA